MPQRPVTPYHEISRIKTVPGQTSILLEGGLEIEGIASDPVSPANGTLWFNYTQNAIKLRSGGVTHILGAGGWDAEALDASAITTGVFDNARLPGARLVRVADTAARYALTADQIAQGDSAIHVGRKARFEVEILEGDAGGGTNRMGFFLAGPNTTSGYLESDVYDEGLLYGSFPVYYSENATAAQRLLAYKEAIDANFAADYTTTIDGYFLIIEANAAASSGYECYSDGYMNFDGTVSNPVVGLDGDGKIFTLVNPDEIGNAAGWLAVTDANAAKAIADQAQLDATAAANAAANAQSIANGAASETTALRPIIYGGTGANNATSARANLGAAGTGVANTFSLSQTFNGTNNTAPNQSRWSPSASTLATRDAVAWEQLINFHRVRKINLAGAARLFGGGGAVDALTQNYVQFRLSNATANQYAQAALATDITLPSDNHGEGIRLNVPLAFSWLQKGGADRQNNTVRLVFGWPAGTPLRMSDSNALTAIGFGVEMEWVSNFAVRARIFSHNGTAYSMSDWTPNFQSYFINAFVFTSDGAGNLALHVSAEAMPTARPSSTPTVTHSGGATGITSSANRSIVLGVVGHTTSNSEEGVLRLYDAKLIVN